ncbi:MAG: hypothetical protein JEY99_03685 [Spirochaetales bacterium]|nr:hypothetical protein [Spirochaetales bacterium]
MSGKSGVVITLPQKISIDKTEVLKGKLEKLKENYPGIALDFRKVEEIDASGIQLLAAFALGCVNDSKEFNCLGPLNESIRENLTLSGILVSDSGDEYLFPFLYTEGVKIESGR